jgi:Uma2 family endonuclease
MDAAMAATRVITDEELLALPRDGSKYEVVDGELVRMSPGGWPHERIISRLVARIQAHVEREKLGDVLGSNAMYVLPSGNKRSPDISFVGAGRLARDAGQDLFPRFAPDLAVEIVSPSETPRKVLDKVGEYLQGGVRLVWVIEPEKRRATSYRALTSVREIGEGQTLDGEEVVPGFRCPLREILD